MRAFRFRLEKVLDWYGRQLQMEERRFGMCLAALADADRAIAHLQAERIAVERDLIARTSIPAREFVALGLYRLRAKAQEMELNSQRDQREAEVRAQRLRVQEAQRRVRLVEKLRERRLTEYAYAATRELDNLATDAYFAKWANLPEG